jgi:Fe(3+) dicitrate transport protein
MAHGAVRYLRLILAHDEIRPCGGHADTIVLAEIRVVGTPAALSRIPGSATLITPAMLQPWRTATMNEALRRVPGVTIREEEGLGLRPNIGVRGLNPTRSTKVLLLEDGIPVTFAPYGDNAAYYHPPITRFESVEVLRGAGQIAFGPQTVGGVINYITPAITQGTTGRISVTGGDRSFLDVNARGMTTFGRLGTLATFGHRQAEGARENTGAQVSDVMVKATTPWEAGAVTLRGNYYRERSNVTYSGLTEAEWAANPYANPFSNDSMKLDRWGVSATHALTLDAHDADDDGLRVGRGPGLVAAVEQLGAATERRIGPGVRRHGEPAHDVRQRGPAAVVPCTTASSRACACTTRCSALASSWRRA